MVSAAERRVEKPEYKTNFYVDGQKLFCEVCQHVVDYTRKSIVDNHLKSDKHKNNIIKAEKLRLTYQTTLDTVSIKLSDCELINIALVNVFTKADILLYKVDKLKSFLLEYCKNGGMIVNSNQLRIKYLPKVFDTEVLKLQNLLKEKQISIIVNETMDACNRAIINILFCFNNQTKLAKTEFITTVDIRETWIHYKNFQFLANIVKNIKATFVHCPARKRQEQINNESYAIQELAIIFNNYTNTFIFKILTMFISINAKHLVEDLEFFETRKKPVAPFVAQ
ncbi:1207_t:CDS:2 [Scutellospora calospora]|uniref:1207_t:CDS:1 n=1 Tax=Scutellospora calospora TaxID=85575 RepID=A0ACA9MJV2_9GLOM|nr:1207_t:CDS:2 [Scutellospora calospora]